MFLVVLDGIEPSATVLSGQCSTAELKDRNSQAGLDARRAGTVI